MIASRAVFCPTLCSIDPARTAIVLIDAQPSFWGWMAQEREPIEARIEQLLLLATMADLPLVATFEHPTESNGWLPERLEKAFPEHGQRYVKRTFDCCSEDEILTALGALRASGIEQIVLAGAETDVCVLQSARGLQQLGFEVFLLEDYWFTREPNTAPALRRMYARGVVPCTYKTLFFELVGTVDRSAQPAEWRECQRALPVPMRSPYELPPSTGHQAEAR